MAETAYNDMVWLMQALDELYAHMSIGQSMFCEVRNNMNEMVSRAHNANEEVSRLYSSLTGYSHVPWRSHSWRHQRKGGGKGKGYSGKGAGKYMDERP